MKESITKVYFAVIFILATGCAPGFNLTGPGSVKKFINTDPVLGKGLTGIEVYDPVARQVLFHYNDRRYFTPASNTKLLTYYAAMKILGDSVPAIHYCQRNDSLFFSGTGDPTLLNIEFPDQPVYDFLKKNSDALVYVPAISTETRFGPGWAWDDYPYYFSPEKSSLPVYGNVVTFKYHTGDSALVIIPSEFTDSVTVDIDTSSLFTGERISRAEFSNQFTVKLNPSDSLEEQIPFTLSGPLSVDLLEDTLRRDILKLNKKPVCKWKMTYNQPVDSVMKVMLCKSDNFLAEQILMTCSSVLFDTLSITHVIQYSRICGTKWFGWMDRVFPDTTCKLRTIS